MNPFISCSYTLGAISVLRNNWNWNNVLISDNKIYIIEQGEIFLKVGDETQVVKAGEMVLIPANVTHSAYITKNGFTKKSWIHFSMREGASDFFAGYNRPIVVTLPNKHYALKVINDVIKNGHLEEPFRSLKTASGIYELISILFSESLPRKQILENSNIEQVIEYINNNFTQNFSLDFLADKFGSSPNHFIKKFKEKTGHTPIKYLAIKRIEKAKKLLDTTNLSINEVMEKVGYDDASYFSKLFKKIVGYSPKNYKESITNTNYEKLF